MARARVIVNSKFNQFGDRVDRAVRETLGETAGHVAGTARSLASPRGGLESTIERSRVARTRRGWLVAVSSRFPGLYQEKGTLRKLGKKGSARGRPAAGSGGRGVKPLRFLFHGLKQHRHELVDGLRRRLS